MAGTPQLFHSLAGCDTQSSFTGIGKNTARVTWDVYTCSLKHTKNWYSADPITDNTMEMTERFVLLTYITEQVI